MKNILILTKEQLAVPGIYKLLEARGYRFLKNGIDGSKVFIKELAY